MKSYLIATILLTLSSVTLGSPPQAGIDYEVLLNPTALPNTGSKITIQEFFSYNCTACLKQSHAIQPIVSRMKDKVSLERIPLKGSVNPGYSAKIYYSLLKIDNTEVAHLSLLKASAKTPEIAVTTKETNSILQTNNVPLGRFNGVYSSVETARKENEGYRLASKYQINSDSAIVVNGRFKIRQDTKNTSVVLNYLISKELQRIQSK